IQSDKGAWGWSRNRSFFRRPHHPDPRRPAGTARPSPSPYGGCAMTDGSDDRAPEEAQAAAELLPTLYTELRRLAAALTAQCGPANSLTRTARVHEASLGRVKDQAPGGRGPRHFLGAASGAMRETLIEQARRKACLKRGGGGHRIELAEGLAWIEPPADDV